MPDFIFADFLASGVRWWARSPGVLSLALFIAAVVAWIALVRWIENRADLDFVQREIDAAKREREAERRRRQMDAVTRISDRRK